MKGEVLHYDDTVGSGLISGADGNRYTFNRADMKQLVPVHRGTKVDFAFDGKAAKAPPLQDALDPTGWTTY